jgi:glycine hydroxymethyltransferase
MNTVPNETRSPFQTSGLRLGTPALTTRGLGESEMQEVTELIHSALSSGGDEQKLSQVAEQVTALCDRFPMHG